MRNYEDLSAFGMANDEVQELLHQQSECTLAWAAPDGWPTAVTMRFLWRNERFWMTATTRRARVGALRADDRVSVVVSSAGSTLDPMLSVTAKGRAVVIDRAGFPEWFFPAWAANHPHVGDDSEEYVEMLDSPGRVVIAVTPERWTSFDGQRMIAATGSAMRARAGS